MGTPQNKNQINNSDLSNIGTVHIGDKIYQPAVETFPKELTLKLPKTHPGDIVGREDDLDALRRFLSTEKRVVQVNGIGGIGKTTLAQVYVSKYYEEYRHIVWIAQDSDNVATDFVNAQGLIENLGINAAGFEPQQLFGEIIRKLKNIADKPNLLIIDNAVQSVKQSLELLPSQPDWHLLLTSREEISGVYRKGLDFLRPGEAVELFKKHYTHKKLDDGQIADLVTMVDRHTLTVEILAKTAEALRYDAGKLQKAIQDDLKANLDIAHNKQATEINKITSYLCAVFNLSGLSETEIWLMKQFVCLPSEFHSYELLEESLINKQGPYAETFAETLSSLAGKGWLLQNRETDSYKMHRIIAEVTKKQHLINSEDVETLQVSLTAKLEIDQTCDNPVDKFIWVPFGMAFLENFNGELYDASTLQNNLALVLQALGDYEGAKGLLEKATASDEKNFGLSHPTTAISYSNLALVLQALGDYEGAKGLLEKATASAEKNFGLSHPTTATRYSNLALVLKDLGDYEGAKGLLEKATASAEKNFGLSHPTTATRYSNLALVLQDLGDYEGAKGLLEKATASAEKNFGLSHPTTATRYSNLALVLKDLGDYEGAKGLLEKATASDEKNFGLSHPTTAISYSNLALVLQDLGDYEGAKGLLEKATASAEKNFGLSHPTTATRYSNLALVLKDLGDYEGAKGLLEKATASDEKNFGLSHPTTAISYSNLALVLKDLGDYEGAKGLLEKATASDEKNFGLSHPATGRSYSNLALVLKDLGDYEGAKGLLEKATASAEKNFGLSHPTTATRYHNLSTVLYQLKNYREALVFSNRALEIFKKTLPAGHPYIGTVNSWNETIKSKIS